MLMFVAPLCMLNLESLVWQDGDKTLNKSYSKHISLKLLSEDACNKRGEQATNYSRIAEF